MEDPSWHEPGTSNSAWHLPRFAQSTRERRFEKNVGDFRLSIPFHSFFWLMDQNLGIRFCIKFVDHARFVYLKVMYLCVICVRFGYAKYNMGESSKIKTKCLGFAVKPTIFASCLSFQVALRGQHLCRSNWSPSLGMEDWGQQGGPSLVMKIYKAKRSSQIFAWHANRQWGCKDFPTIFPHQLHFTLPPKKKTHAPADTRPLIFLNRGKKKKKTYPQPIKLLDGLCMRHVRQLHGIAAIVGTLICHRLLANRRFWGRIKASTSEMHSMKRASPKEIHKN